MTTKEESDDRREETWVPITYISDLFSITPATAKIWVEEENLTVFHKGKTVRIIKQEVDDLVDKYTKKSNK